MALPEVQLPADFPPFRAADHVISPEALYVGVPRQAGEDRQRRLFRSVPRMVTASFELTQAQLEAFYVWFEGALEAGSLPFSASIARVGPGTEWWKAYAIGGYTVDFQEGAQHLVQLTLKLIGDPSSTAPARTTMTAEVSVGLATSSSLDFGQVMSAEVYTVLEVTADVGPLLSASVLCRLYTTVDGGPTDVSFDAEVALELQTLAIEVPGEAFTAEVTIDLLTASFDDPAMTSEVSPALSLTVTAGANYVASPGALVLSSYMGYSPGGQASVDFRYGSDGLIRKQLNTSGVTTHANWWSPTQPGAGTGNWVRVTHLTGDAFNGSSEAVGAWISLSSTRTWQLARSAVGVSSLTATVEVASDPDGTNIVSTMSVTLDAEYAT